MARHNLIGLFESRKGHLDYRLKRDYVKNGIATIPCRVSTYHADDARFLGHLFPARAGVILAKRLLHPSL